jgi:hypothetical protein
MSIYEKPVRLVFRDMMKDLNLVKGKSSQKVALRNGLKEVSKDQRGNYIGTSSAILHHRSESHTLQRETWRRSPVPGELTLWLSLANL